MVELIAFRVASYAWRHAIGRTVGVRKPGSTRSELKTFNDTNSSKLLVKDTNSFSATEHAQAGGLATIRSLDRHRTIRARLTGTTMRPLCTARQRGYNLVPRLWSGGDDGDASSFTREYRGPRQEGDRRVRSAP